MRRRIRVLQAITTSIGGAGEYVLRLAGGLDRDRFAVELAFARGAPLDGALDALGLPITEMPWDRAGGAVGMVAAYVRLRRLIAERRYDLVVTHTSVAGAVARLAARADGRPLVVHTAHTLAADAATAAWRRTAYRTAERALAKLSDALVAVSPAVARTLIRDGAAKRGGLAVVGYHLDLADFDARRPTRAEARAKLGLEAGTPVVCFAGRFERQKGLDVLLAAWERLHAVHPTALLLMAGDGPLRPADPGPGVRLLGWRDDVPALLAAADVAVVPSRYEPFGIVSLEALAAGVPLVASAVGGIPAVVGPAGMLVPPDDPAALAAALGGILGDPRRAAECAAAGRRRVEERFANGDPAVGHARLYERLMRRGRRWT